MDSNFNYQMLQNSLICRWMNLPFYGPCFPSVSCFAKTNELSGDSADQLLFYYSMLIIWGKLLTQKWANNTHYTCIVYLSLSTSFHQRRLKTTGLNSTSCIDGNGQCFTRTISVLGKCSYCQ